MVSRGNLSVIEGDGGKPDKHAVSGDVPPGVARARAIIGRYLASNTSRSQLPPLLVRRLDEIRKNGNNLLALLEPYHDASVFILESSEKFAAALPKKGKDEREERELQLYASAPQRFRQKLNNAAVEFVGPRCEVFPKNEKDRDVETTCAISAFLFAGAAARYVPDLILESPADASVKQKEAEWFIGFFDHKLSDFTISGRKWKDAVQLHRSCYAAYLDFKKEMPDLFARLMAKLMNPGGDIMALYGEGKYDGGWAYRHYKGNL